MILMHLNNPVYNFQTREIYSPELIPKVYGRQVETLHSDLFIWINNRLTSIQRVYADKLYDCLGSAQLENVMLQTYGLSINDNYWVASAGKIGSIKWEDISPFHNKLNEDIAELALTGKHPNCECSSLITTEYTLSGTYPKCVGYGFTGLVLYKLGKNSEIEAEIFAFHVAMALGIKTVQYHLCSNHNLTAVASPICTSEKVSWISAFDCTKFFEQNFGMNVYDFASTYFPIPFYQMVVLDGLVLNPDRHLQNWSFEVDGYTNQILGLAPCYDYNKAFTGTRTDMSREIPHNNILSAARMAFPNSGISTDSMLNLISLTDKLPKDLQDPFYNRVLYILNKKSSQDRCY